MFSFDTLRLSLRWPRAAVVGVLLFCAADAFHRKFIPPPAKNLFHLKTPKTHRVFRPDPSVFRGVTGESRFTINSRGIRGPEMPPRGSAYRILCLGDSVTECLYLDDNETWPAVVMQRLNQEKNMPRVWVGNVGQSGYSCYHHLRFLKVSDLVKEVDCVVLMTGSVDFAYGISGDEETFPETGRQKSKSWIETFFKEVRGKFKKKKKSKAIVQDLKGETFIALRQERMKGRKCDRLPDLTGPLNLYRQRLRDIVTLCREKGVRLIMVSSAFIWRSGLPPEDESIIWGGQLPDGRFLCAQAISEGIAMYNKVTAEVAQEMNVEFVDASPLNGQSDLFYDGSHLNEEGARRLAGLVADCFLAHRDGNRWQPAQGAKPAPAN
ncbi:MAG: SGNH/GDSL hydrolase family protein [Verrucomicrobiae bacterium]|nr:SGNH/GDSL hydrolase family protein [Verrucomicrobiae bacterium]